MLPVPALRVLEQLWQSHRHPRLLFPGTAIGGSHVDHPMDRGTTQRAFARVVADCGIRKHVSIHSLRHSYATHLIEIGLNLRSVQEQLGHASPTTPARYVHMTDVARADTRDLINRLTERLAQALPATGL